MTRPAFPKDAFAGTAPYYLRYRPAYPASLVEDLLSRAGIREDAKLLDLACGPGRLTFALARSFAAVEAVDLEPETIGAARREAERLGAFNIVWSVGKAEDFVPSASAFDLITVGDAFHRLDQDRVIRNVLSWLKPRGSFAILGSRDTLSGTERWHEIVKTVVLRWTQRPPIWNPADSGPERCEAMLRAAGFQQVASFEFFVPNAWSIDAILGNLNSTSYCSRAALGANADAFAADLERALLAHDSSGSYKETMRFGYTFGRKPG